MAVTKCCIHVELHMSRILLMVAICISGCFISNEKLGEAEDPDGDQYDWNVDCDNEDPDVNPGMTEICGDGIDNDCNDETDDECTDTGDSGL
jgi:hypothetical protein